MALNFQLKRVTAGPGDFIHSDRFVLVDGKGRIRGYYSGTDPDEVDKLIKDIKIILRER
jgi:protein SCO1/2